MSGPEEADGRDGRDRFGRFIAGVSGNPAGRPPANRDLGELLDGSALRVTELLAELLAVAIEAPALVLEDAAEGFERVAVSFDDAAAACRALAAGARRTG